MRTIVNFRYFVGCINLDQLKSKYKELAKRLHPDAGGVHAEFVAMKAEYDEIATNNLFPVKNQQSSFNGVFTHPTTPRESVVNLSPEEILKRKAEAYFASNRDEYYDTIEELVRNQVANNRKRYWALAELSKLDDLKEHHFKYLFYVLRLDVKMAKTAYVNYLTNKIGSIPSFKK
jgi:hypothetical protein